MSDLDIYFIFCYSSAFALCVLASVFYNSTEEERQKEEIPFPIELAGFFILSPLLMPIVAVFSTLVGTGFILYGLGQFIRFIFITKTNR
jgi:hypothetical protein